MSEDAAAGVDVAFVCVQNAGRSQMSAAFAEREVERRGLADAVTVHTGGTRPADAVHEGVVDAMADAGIDVSEREPREIGAAELERCDYVATMGCSTLELDADAVEVRNWALPDPDGQPAERVREIRDEVEEHVRALLDEVEGDLGGDEGSGGEASGGAAQGSDAGAREADDADANDAVER